MNNYIRIFVVWALVVLCAGPALAEEQAQKRLVTVNGEAEVLVVPDEVYVNLGVTSFDADKSKAKNENDKIVKALMKFIKEIGVEDKHVQTDYLNVQPKYNYNQDYGYNFKKIEGFIVTKNIAVKLVDVKKLEILIDNALDLGATGVGNVEFKTSQFRQKREEARLLAVKAAQEKAQNLAKALGQELGKPYGITEETAIVNYWQPALGVRSPYSNTAQVQLSAAESSVADADNPGTIALGLIKIKARIVTSFELVG